MISPRPQPHSRSHDSRSRQGSKISRDTDPHKEMDTHHSEDHPHPQPLHRPQTTSPRTIGIREITNMVCSDCGKECKVPFMSTQVRPVYCRECFPRPELPGSNADVLSPVHETTAHLETTLTSTQFLFSSELGFSLFRYPFSGATTLVMTAILGLEMSPTGLR